MNKKLPTICEWQELIDNCEWKWGEQKKGMKVTGKNGNNIFLPAFGFKSGNHILYIKIFGDYWSSTLSKVNRYEAWKVSFGSDDILMCPKHRVELMSVRPVSDTEQEDFVDLGLPSGLLWAEKNIGGYYTYDEAVGLFKNEGIEANGKKIASGTNDSELKGWSYNIPKGFEAKIKDGKVIVKEKESEDERRRKEMIAYFQDIKEVATKPENLDKWFIYLEKQKDVSKAIEVEVYEIGKGTTICGQDYKCKKDYRTGTCWYIKDVIYHCGRDGYLTDQNGVSWSCTPEWFKEYIQSNTEWAEEEKTQFVGGQFLQCKLSFDRFKEGEHYWLEYVGDDMYVGRSDNILNQKFHITPRQLYTLFSHQLEEVQGLPQEEEQVSLNYEPPFDENPSDKEIIEALIKHLKEQDGFLTAINCVSTEAILSWLKEQKSVDNVSIEEYVKRFKVLCDAYEIKLPNREYDIYHLCDDLSKLFTDYGKQKPTELPKSEDYGVDGLYAAVDILQKTLGEVDGYQSDDGILEHKCAISAVKELYEQKPVEWSDEDELMRTTVIQTLKRFGGSGATGMQIDWLKSLSAKIK